MKLTTLIIVALAGLTFALAGCGNSCLNQMGSDHPAGRCQ